MVKRMKKVSVEKVLCDLETLRENIIDSFEPSKNEEGIEAVSALKSSVQSFSNTVCKTLDKKKADVEQQVKLDEFMSVKRELSKAGLSLDEVLIMAGIRDEKSETQDSDDSETSDVEEDEASVSSGYEFNL
jgi:hypothetical protein